MPKLKLFYDHFMVYLRRFTKRPKKKGQPKLRTVNKQTVNLAVLSGLAFILLVGLFGSIRAMTLSSKVNRLDETITKVKERKPTAVVSKSVDNRLQYYLSDFIYWYFTIPEDNDGQVEQANKLKEFYGSEPDIQAQGQSKNFSKLDWSRLIMVKDNVATYEVHYIQKLKDGNKTKEEKVATAFNIPFVKKADGYCVSGLPWFASLTNNQTTKAVDSVKLNKSDNLSEKETKKLDKFLDVFFTNYTTNQDNLNLIAKNVRVVDNTTFKSLDYSYYKKTKKGITATAQVTFDVSGSTHSENFTLLLIKKGKSYYVNQLKHMIPTDYAK